MYTYMYKVIINYGLMEDDAYECMDMCNTETLSLQPFQGSAPEIFVSVVKKVASFPGKKGARAYYGARAMRLLIKSRHV